MIKTAFISASSVLGVVRRVCVFISFKPRKIKTVVITEELATRGFDQGGNHPS